MCEQGRVHLIGAGLLGLLAMGAQAASSIQPDEGRQVELLALLQQDCGSCHGSTLKGGLGPALLPERLAGRSRDLLVATVRDGRPGTAMPPWGPILDNSEIGWLVDRILAGEGAAK